jgi:uncharacterized cupredoxin-like copper-binding protein
MRLRPGGLLTLALAALPLFLAACGSASAHEETIGIHYSHFNPELITVTAGEPITIELRNDDPIAHEWIVGTEEVHARHRTGTEPVHDQIPTEVSIPALTTKWTTVIFDEPGDYQYICHLPTHEQYGMVGTLRVLPK